MTQIEVTGAVDRKALIRAYRRLPVVRLGRRKNGLAMTLAVPLLLLFLLSNRDVVTLGLSVYRGPEVVSAREFERAVREGSLNKFVGASKYRELEIPPLPVVSANFSIGRRDGAKRYVRFVVVGDTLIPATTLNPDDPLPVRGIFERAKPSLLKKANAQLSNFGPNAKAAPFVLYTDRHGYNRLAVGLMLFVPLLILLWLASALFMAIRNTIRRLREVRGLTDEQLIRVGRIMKLGGDGNTVFGEGLIVRNNRRELIQIDVATIIWAYPLGGDPNRKLYVHVENSDPIELPLTDASQESAVLDYIRNQNPSATLLFNPTMDRLWGSKRSELVEAFREVQSESGSPEDVMVRAEQIVSDVVTSAPRTKEKKLVTPGRLVAYSAFASLILSPLIVLPSLARPPIKRARVYPATWEARDKPLVAFMEKTRGKPFRHPVRIDLLSESMYDSISGNKAEREIATCTYDARCQESGEALDVRRSMFELLGLRGGRDAGGTSETGAYYTGVENRIFVRGTKLTPFLRSVIVHELTHAWQDQHFDLDAKFKRVKSSDQYVAFRSLVEGDATHVEEMYWQSLNIARDEPTKPTWRPSSFEYLEEVGFEFPYAYGPSYVKLLRQKAGLPALDRRFTELPTTVQEIMDGKRRAAIEWPDDAHAAKETTLYEESLDALEYYVLLADQQPVDFDALVANWNGARVQLVSYQASRCARIILGKPKNGGKQQLPQLLNDPTKGLPDVSTDDTDSVSNCAPIGKSAKLRTGDLRAVDRVMRRGFAMVPLSVDVTTKVEADRTRADKELAKADQRGDSTAP
jgi:hypothetical protein